MNILVIDNHGNRENIFALSTHPDELARHITSNGFDWKIDCKKFEKEEDFFAFVDWELRFCIAISLYKGSTIQLFNKQYSLNSLAKDAYEEFCRVYGELLTNIRNCRHRIVSAKLCGSIHVLQIGERFH